MTTYLISSFQGLEYHHFNFACKSLFTNRLKRLSLYKVFHQLIYIKRTISLPCISLRRCCSFHFSLFSARIIFSFIRVKRCFNVFLVCTAVFFYALAASHLPISYSLDLTAILARKWLG